MANPGRITREVISAIMDRARDTADENNDIRKDALIQFVDDLAHSETIVNDIQSMIRSCREHSDNIDAAVGTREFRNTMIREISLYAYHDILAAYVGDGEVK